MKKAFCVLLALASCVSLCSSALAFDGELRDINFDEQLVQMNFPVVSRRGTYRCEIASNGVNVRAAPTTSSKSLGMMNKGDIVYSQGLVIGEAVDGTETMWHEVICSSPNKGLHGYIYYNYVNYLE